MLGIIFQAIASFFEEISGSLEKLIVEKKLASFYAIGFLNAALSLGFYAIYALTGKGRFVIHPASLPSLAVLVILAVAQAYATMKGTSLAARSTFNFVRTGTMPLLLLADLALGYGIGWRQILGIACIVLALLVLFMNHGIERRGLGLVVFTAINAAVTISIYKWHITKWNSVAAEQLVLHVFIAAYFLFGAVRLRRENPFRLLRNRTALAQTGSYAFGSFLEGFAYQYAPASIILAAKRSFAVLWSILAGNRVFHEKRLVLKLITFIMVAAGIVLLAVA
ncbi:hypothetical protein A3C96_01395 [Candidatus Uhrbacteria bacterium RIFCSPHIGHO2_02_FULL_60_10]|uniref:EamA domain-containing protein n=1 Tax=Candidatus Uhrbacteria bacterium RIFCSPHIGHO2_02_FULL_60_10 TaxID=1802392 RepID=A0A1F7U6N0_9BACT|nr:MAG: hypothetical protein A3C96_01395 [Candidatus Uhrbacteria bacterium RIFCSPHIGHO2_02_FULL_60_10]